jgi:predicted nucleotidyltransferase
MARGTADEFSDVDVWLTFRNEDMTQALENRFEYYAQIGGIVHIVEPPQNSPVGGIQSTVLYKQK